MYLTYEDLINGSYEETLPVLQRHQENALQAITDAMGEVKAYLFKLYDIDAQFSLSGSSRSALLVKLIRDIAIYNIYCIASPALMSETRRLKYDDAIAFLRLVAAQKAFIPGLKALSSSASGGSYPIAYGGNSQRNNQY